jgi:hypothetical protein
MWQIVYILLYFLSQFNRKVDIFYKRRIEFGNEVARFARKRRRPPKAGREKSRGGSRSEEVPPDGGTLDR